MPADEGPGDGGQVGQRNGGDELESDAPGGGLAAQLSGVGVPVASVVEPIVDHIVTPVAEHIVGSVAGAIGSVIEAAAQAFAVRDVLNERRLRRSIREPLANLYELYPGAREASPRELGLRFVPVEEIRGTAVAGIAQRGGDFLPLRPFRGANWEGRWDRIREANKNLKPLPPVDLIKYDGDYWVLDGHNRVAAALYGNIVGLDAMVIELVPLDGQASERPSNVLSLLGEAGALRAAAAGHRPAMGMRRAELDAPQRGDLDPSFGPGPTSESAATDREPGAK
jgi:hypothetical protein